MSSEPGLSTDDAIRALLALMPRLVGRAKRLPPPDELRSFDLAPRHLSLLSYLLFDGPMTVNDLAGRLEVAPTTASLMVGDLSRMGILERREDDADRRRRIVSITAERQPAIRAWLARGATAWREALGSLTPEQRRTFVSTLLAYERALDSELPDTRNSRSPGRADYRGGSEHTEPGCPRPRRAAGCRISRAEFCPHSSTYEMATFNPFIVRI